MSKILEEVNAGGANVIALYGTLRSGQRNHRIIEKLVANEECLRVPLDDKTIPFLPCTTLVKLPNDIPTIIFHNTSLERRYPGTSVAVELYYATHRAADIIEYFEGGPSFFRSEWTGVLCNVLDDNGDIIAANKMIVVGPPGKATKISSVLVWRFNLESSETYPTLLPKTLGGMVDWTNSDTVNSETVPFNTIADAGRLTVRLGDGGIPRPLRGRGDDEQHEEEEDYNSGEDMDEERPGINMLSRISPPRSFRATPPPSPLA